MFITQNKGHEFESQLGSSILHDCVGAPQFTYHQKHVLLVQFPVSTHDHASCSQALNGAKEQVCSNIKNTHNTNKHNNRQRTS